MSAASHPGSRTEPGSFGMRGGVGDVVGHGVGDRGIGVQGLLGGGHADPLGQVRGPARRPPSKRTSSCPGTYAGLRGRIRGRGPPRPRGRWPRQDEHGCGDQLSHGLSRVDVKLPGRSKHVPGSAGRSAVSRILRRMADRRNDRADDASHACGSADGRAAATHGDVPIGAVVARDGEVLGAAGNERELRRDPTAHAEVLAILRQAAERWAAGACRAPPST